MLFLAFVLSAVRLGAAESADRCAVANEFTCLPTCPPTWGPKRCDA